MPIFRDGDKVDPKSRERALEKRSLASIIAEIEANITEGRKTSDAVLLPALRNINERLLYLETDGVRRAGGRDGGR